MVATAHVLISVAAGKAKKVYNQLHDLEGVQHVDAVSGPYDLIATIQGPDFNALANLVLDKIHTIDGVTDTITCNVISFEP